jgi:hypothetical protein
MSRFPRLALLLVTGALLVAAMPAGAPAATDNGPTASAARSCSVGDSRSYGTTYVLWIRARHASCSRARKVVRGFHKCRRGATGRCGSFNGWHCSENRDYGRGSYYSTVRCKRGAKVVRHKYNQWT